MGLLTVVILLVMGYFGIVAGEEIKEVVDKIAKSEQAQIEVVSSKMMIKSSSPLSLLNIRLKKRKLS